MGQNKNDYWSGKKSVLYGVLGCFFVFALLIHWNQNYRKYNQAVKTETVTESQIQSLLTVFKNYSELNAIISDRKNAPFLLKLIVDFEPGKPYEDWQQDKLPVNIQAAIVRFSKARSHLKIAQESAQEQIRLNYENRTIDEDLKNKTGVELASALKDATAAVNIVLEYKEKNP